jgi:phosphoserine phosphatase RsbU/P
VAGTVVGDAIDLTDRLSTELERRTSDQRYRSLIEATTSVVWTLDAEGRAVERQPSWEAYTGQTWEEYRDFGWLEALHPDDRERWFAEWQRFRAANQTFEAHAQLWHAAHGAYRHCVMRGAPVHSRDGTLREWVGTSTDIHDRRLRDQEAAHTAALLDSIMRRAPIGIGFFDRDLRYVMLNDQLAEINGAPIEDHLGKTVAEVIPEVADKHEPLFRAVLETGQPVLDIEIETDTPAQPGVARSWLVNYYPVHADDGVIGVGATVAEITDRKRLDAALREAETARATAHLAGELEAAQRIAQLGSWEWSAPTGRLGWSREMFRLFGFPLDDVPDPAEIGRRLHPDDLGELERAMASARAGTTDEFTLEQRIQGPDGRTRVLRTVAQVVRDHHEVVGVRGTTQDVTQQRENEQALRQAREELFRTEMQRAREHRAVEAMQRAVLPGELPSVAGAELAAAYQPADVDMAVGGDWYDAFSLDEHRIVLAIGDVAGHGTGSAAMMGQLRNALRAYALDDRSPGEVLAALDRLVHRLSTDWYATAVVAVLDHRTGVLQWSHAGHPPPVRFSPSSVEFLELVGTGGPLLGAVPGARYLDAEIALDVDESLLLYTDGLIERRGVPIDAGLAALSSEVRAARHGSASSICEQLITSVLAEHPREDDICELVVRRRAISRRGPLGE